MCQPMTGCSWEHATSWTTESAVFKKVCPACSMRQVLVAVCLVLLLHVATPECTRVIIAGQHYDVDNTP